MSLVSLYVDFLHLKNEQADEVLKIILNQAEIFGVWQMTGQQFSPSTIEILKKLKRFGPSITKILTTFCKYGEKQLSLVNELSDKILAVKKGEISTSSEL